MSVHAPDLWQELARGMQGRSDVMAAQRGVWRAGSELGYASGNARNGTYGQATSDDVGSFRRATGMEGAGSNDQIGATLWPVIWPYLDSRAWVLFCNQPEAVSAPAPAAKKLPLKQGQKSKGVEAAQRALWRALPSSGNSRNGTYGDETCADVEAFRDRYQVNAGDDGTSIGGDLWNVLTRWMDDNARQLVQEWQPDPEPAPPASGSAMSRAVQAALGQVGYQEGSGNSNKFGAWYGMDYQSWCAMFCTWCAEQGAGSETFVKGSRYAYCPYVVDDARAGRNGLKVVPASQASRGCLVLYDWQGDGVADHIGFVVDGPGSGSSFHTVEGNTSGGSGGSQSNGDGVYERTRYTSDVVLFATFS